MQNVPDETVTAWMSKRGSLDARRLIPAIIQYDHVKQTAQVGVGDVIHHEHAKQMCHNVLSNSTLENNIDTLCSLRNRRLLIFCALLVLMKLCLLIGQRCYSLLGVLCTEVGDTGRGDSQLPALALRQATARETDDIPQLPGQRKQIIISHSKFFKISTNCRVVLSKRFKLLLIHITGLQYTIVFFYL